MLSQFEESGIVEQSSEGLTEVSLKQTNITAEQLQAIGIYKPLAVQLAENKAKAEEEKSVIHYDGACSIDLKHFDSDDNVSLRSLLLLLMKIRRNFSSSKRSPSESQGRPDSDSLMQTLKNLLERWKTS